MTVNTTVILCFGQNIALAWFEKDNGLVLLKLFKMCKTLFHLALSCKRLHYLSPTLKNRCQDLTHFEKKKNVLNSCTQRYLCLSCSRILLLVSDNADEKTSSTVFNPAWAWLGAVVAILLLSTALVVIRKFKHNRRNSTHEDDHAANTEVVTGYTRF